jgi:hypothetical protein
MSNNDQQQQKVSTFAFVYILSSIKSIRISLDTHTIYIHTHTQTHPQQPYKYQTEEDYNAFLRISHESTQIGQQTLTAMAGQQESLDRAEGMVDSNKYMIEKSARTLRGMSWWGSVVNYFTEEPVAPRPRESAWMKEAGVGGGGNGGRGGGGGGGEGAQQAQGGGVGRWKEASSSSSNGDGMTSTTSGGGGGSSPHVNTNTNSRTHTHVNERQELYARNNGTSSSSTSNTHTPQQQQQQQNKPSLAEVQRIQDSYLANLSTSIDEQRAIGQTLNQALTQQTGQSVHTHTHINHPFSIISNPKQAFTHFTYTHTHRTNHPPRGQQ